MSRPRPGPYALATALAATLSSGFTLSTQAAPDPAPWPTATADSTAHATPPDEADRLAPRRFLLNALLAPALDVDHEPPRWLDPRPVMACAAGSVVLIDGAPLEPESLVPAGPFVLAWRAVRCHPFGLAGPRYDGAVRLLVSHSGERWWSTVLPDDLAVTLASGRVIPIAAGQAFMPLDQAAVITAARPVAIQEKWQALLAAQPVPESRP